MKKDPRFKYTCDFCGVVISKHEEAVHACCEGKVYTFHNGFCRRKWREQRYEKEKDVH